MFLTNIHEKFALPLNQSLYSALVVSIFFHCLCAVVSISGNLLALLVYVKRVLHRRAKTTDFLILNMAISDFILGLIVLPLMVFTDVFILCRHVLFLRAVLESILMPFLSSISLWTVLGASIDRLISLKKPFEYKNIMSPSRVRKWIIFIWTCASSWTWFPFLPG